MRIGEVANRAEVSVETIRFYERRGLIAQPPKPLDGGYRTYPEETVRRIRFVRNAQQLGFSIAEILELLELRATDTACRIDVRRRAQAKFAEVEAKIEQLVRIKRLLRELLRSCSGKGPARKCSILAAIDSGDLKLDIAPKGG
jgi:MerR family mercuric resistance operon transcriptional regulator